MVGYINGASYSNERNGIYCKKEWELTQNPYNGLADGYAIASPIKSTTIGHSSRDRYSYLGSYNVESGVNIRPIVCIPQYKFKFNYELQ